MNFAHVTKKWKKDSILCRITCVLYVSRRNTKVTNGKQQITINAEYYTDTGTNRKNRKKWILILDISKSSS